MSTSGSLMPSGSAASTNNLAANMRDSVSSFQSYLSNNTGTSSLSPGTSPTGQVTRPNRNFRKIAISSIFASSHHNNQRNHSVYIIPITDCEIIIV